MSQPPINRLGSVMSLLNMHHMLRLFWALQLDGRVSPLLKIQAWCGLVYFISPLDVTPDFFTGVGLLDDLIMCLILLQAFVELAPREVVGWHCQRLNIDIEKVFVSVPSTVREAMEIYNWASQRFAGFAAAGEDSIPRPRSAYSRRVDEPNAQPAEPRPESDDPGEVHWPENSEPRRYERYSAFRKEDS